MKTIKMLTVFTVLVLWHCVHAGWSSHNGVQYQAVTSQKTYSDALAYCRSSGGSLARPSSSSDLTYIAGLLPGKYFFIDAHKTGGTFKWSDGSAIHWTQWDTHQDQGDDCVVISGSDSDWLDKKCSDHHPFVCQKNSHSHSSPSTGSQSTNPPKIGLPCTPTGHRYQVSSVSSIESRAQSLKAGDVLEIADGTYRNAEIRITNSGTHDCGHRIFIRAKNPGKVILKDNSYIYYGGSYIDVEGVQFTGHTSKIVVAVQMAKGTHNNRFAESAIVNLNPSFHPTKHVWLEAFGSYHVIERNAFLGKTYPGEMLRVKGDVASQRESWGHRFAYNYFGPRPIGSNGGEAIQIGLYNHEHNLETTVEYNYFYEYLKDHTGHHADTEIISTKSSNNTVRYNTLQHCGGLISFRFGDRNIADGNFIFCEKTDGCGGVRMRGSHHRIVNNYIGGAEGTSKARGAINMIPDEEGGHNLVAFNTFYNCDICIQIGLDSGSHTMTNNIFSNNIVQGTSSSSYLVKINREKGTVFENNIMYHGRIDRYSSSIHQMNPHLMKDRYGLEEPGRAPSPVIQASRGHYQHSVGEDILGRPRTHYPTDVGAVLSSTTTKSAAVRAPVRRGDVGPTWARDDSHLVH